MRVDVRRKEDIHELYCGAIGAVGVPNLIVASAGVGVHERLEEGDPEKWAEVVQTNLLGTLRLVRAFLPEMPGGDIVFISSVAAQRPYEYGGAYAASKAALSMAAETLRIELKGRVRTTVVSPGMVDTGFFENELGGSERGGGTDSDEAALSPEDIADAIVYAITRPNHLAVHELTLRPRAQRF
jgi:NADP-dependent 3-hydroxy acid dehydrogenase YdfG